MNPTGSMQNKAKAAILLSGISAGMVQIVALREILAGFYGTELLTGIVSAGWMAMTGLGCLLSARMLTRVSFPTILRLQTALGICGLLTCLGMLIGCSHLASNAHSQVNWLSYTALTLLILLPFCMLSGVQYAASVRILEGLPGYDGVAAASAGYVYDCVGMLAGFSVATFFLLTRLNTVESALLVMGVNLAAAVLISLCMPALRRSGIFLAFAGIVLFASAYAFSVPDWLFQSAIESRVPSETLLETADTEYSRIIVTESSGQYNFYANGYLEGAYPQYDEAIEKRVHFALLLHPDPQRIFVMGGLTSGVLDEVLKYQPNEIVYGDIDPNNISVAMRYIWNSSKAGYETVRFVTSDARSYLQQAKESFDVIILLPPPPATLAANRYYTREFFSLAEEALRDDGLFVTGIPSSETYTGQNMRRLNASVLSGLQSVFQNTLILPGEEGIVLAAKGYAEWTDMEQTVLRHYDERNLPTKLVTPELIRYTLDPSRIEETKENAEYRGLSITDSDYFPSAVRYYSAVVNERENLANGGILDFLSAQPPLRLFLIFIFLLILPFAVLLSVGLFLKGKRKLHTGPVAFLSGLAGYSCMTVFIYLYQIRIGSLFGDIGLLSALNLGGYMAGAIAAGKLKKTGVRRIVSVFLGTLVLLAAILLSVWFPAMLWHKAVFILFVISSGCLFGMVYPLLSRYVACLEQKNLGAYLNLYAFELAGSALGAALVGLVLLGTIGLMYTVIFIIVVVILNIILISSLSMKSKT
jgi:spermidine synthase